MCPSSGNRHFHGKKSAAEPTLQKPRASSSNEFLPSWITDSVDGLLPDDAKTKVAWDPTLEPFLTSKLKRHLRREGFTSAADISGLTSAELQEMDPAAPPEKLRMILHMAAKVPKQIVATAGAGRALIQERAAACCLQAIQTMKSSMAITALEKTNLPVQSGNRRQFHLETIWFVFMVMGSQGLLLC